MSEWVVTVLVAHREIVQAPTAERAKRIAEAVANGSHEEKRSWAVEAQRVRRRPA